MFISLGKVLIYPPPPNLTRAFCSKTGTETGHSSGTSVKAETIAKSTGTEKVKANKTDEMTNFMDDLTLSSPKGRNSHSRSKRSRDRSTSRSSSRSSSSSQSSSSSSSSASSRSWSRSRTRSRSRARRNGSRRYRQYSRSYSRSRSRSRSYRCRGRCYPRHYRRYRRSPPRYRSRSRSWSRGRSYYRRSYSRSRSRSRGRRYYGFGRTIYPEAYRNWRNRSRTRSRSRSLHLSEKDKRELLEIAKANAAKVLGTNNIVLPASLRLNTASKETNSGNLKSEDAAESTEPSGRLTEDLLRSGTERATAQRGISFSPNNTMAKPVAQKPASLSVKEITISPGRDDDRKGNPYGQWVPIKKEENNSFLNFSPKSAPFRAR
ncbi:arginine/serine-rich protein 1 [Alligator sinensis]|uniref:Arginine/serine-rich protein 1 n=1 Tax=Alligator sinensis TaxID=38654 RepID=A0A1U7RG00_ALLSI|nr:arginine/serine-rich protein 1 [Alligator sinensis]